jgi:hypothetical protein
VTYRQLPPGAELRAAMAAERQRLISDGWRADDIKRYGFCFCEKEDERWCVSIEHFEPGHLPPSHGSFHGGPARGK